MISLIFNIISRAVDVQCFLLTYVYTYIFHIYTYTKRYILRWVHPQSMGGMCKAEIGLSTGIQNLLTNITRIGQGQYLKTIALSLGLVEEQLTVLSKTIHRCKKMARVSCKLCSIWKSVFSKWECCYTKKSDTSRQHNQRFGFSTWQRNKVAVNRDLNILTLKYYFM